MRVALIGATGTIGGRILKEAQVRGHAVTPVVRSSSRSPTGLTDVAIADVRDATGVARAVAGHDAVISAVGGVAAGEPRLVVHAAHALISGLQVAGVRRLLVVGGAGSLLVAGGRRLVDSPAFPDAWKPGSLAQCDALDVFRSEGATLEWTYISPADVIEPGVRTAEYVVGGDELIVGADGKSAISTEDYAVAVVDELERPRHIRQRISVGYS